MTGPDRAEGTAVLSDEEREAVIASLRWFPRPGVEWFNFRDGVLAAVERILAARAALPGTADECVGCPPCPGRGNDGHGMTHCAECCFGTHVEADPTCPVHGEAAYPRTADTGAREAELRRHVQILQREWRARSEEYLANAKNRIDAGLGAAYSVCSESLRAALAATPDGHQHAAEES